MPSDSMYAKAAELVERDAWLDMFAAAPRQAADALGLAFADRGGIGLLASRTVPITEFNRAMAIGVEAPVSAEDLDASLAWLETHAAEGWAFQQSHATETEATGAWFTDHSMAPTGNGWAKLHLLSTSSDDAHPTSGIIDVRRANSTSATVYGEIVQTVFGFPASTVEWFAALVDRANWTTYLAYDGDVPVGSGAVFARNGAAWLGIGTVLSPFRRRGVQSALLARRIADARDQDIEIITTETGYPGANETAFPSYRNVRRAGFALAYVRPNYKRS